MIDNVVIRKFFASLVLFCSVFASSAIYANDPAPVTVLKESTIEMLAALKSHQGTLKSHPKYLEDQIRRIVVPKFDLTSMSQSVVGRRYWDESSPAMRQAFIREFTDLVINVYSAPLLDYNGDKVHFLPLRENIGGQSRVVVQTIIVRPTGQRIAVNYSLKNSGAAWKVYDFSIEGISMVASYRSQFAEVLEAKGMSGLLAQIRSHSRAIS
ncbi:MAG: ABC transporter substrate-binding protein [Gammaproteobacteria bacterium]|nr:ABC transporter substrate-binding protein [Gammaproteobacteria bacterium]